MSEQHKPDSFTRRSFLQAGAVAAAGIMIVPRHVLGGKRYTAPSDKLNIAAVGAGGKGMYNLTHAFNNGSDNIAVLCDVDDRQAKAAREKWPLPGITKIPPDAGKRKQKHRCRHCKHTRPHACTNSYGGHATGKHVYVENH
jgi:hypothetical protein